MTVSMFIASLEHHERNVFLTNKFNKLHNYYD